MTQTEVDWVQKEFIFPITTSWNSTLDLEGEFVTAYLYEWDDNFVDVNDANFAFGSLTNIAEGEYYFESGEDSVSVLAAFNTPVMIEDDQRYLACVEVWNEDIWLGYNNRIDYNRNIDHYLQPLVPTVSSGTYYWIGFATDLVPAIALKVI